MGTADDTAHEGADAPRRLRRGSAVREFLVFWAYPLAALLIVAMVQSTGLLRVHNVASGSMRETLGVSDRILVSAVPYAAAPPARGDIVVFSHGETWADEVRTPASNPLAVAARTFGDWTGIGTSNRIYTVKRVVGVGGDIVACCDAAGSVTVGGVVAAEPFIFEDLTFLPGTFDCTTTPRSPRCFDPVRVPDGTLLVMGDHRSNSDDSVAACRAGTPAADCARFVPLSRVVGKVVGKAWPPGPVG